MKSYVLHGAVGQAGDKPLTAWPFEQYALPTGVGVEVTVVVLVVVVVVVVVTVVKDVAVIFWYAGQPDTSVLRGRLVWPTMTDVAVTEVVIEAVTDL